MPAQNWILEGSIMSNETDNSRFLRLFTSSNDRIYAYIVASVHSRVDADEIMQETAVVMWRRLDVFEGGNFAAWGIGIARNLILRFYRENKKNRAMFDNTVLDAIEDIAAKKTSEMNDRVDYLRSCVRKLKPSDRKLLKLKYDRNTKIKEISDLVGASVATMYRSFARIHILLQECIRKQLTEVGD